MASQKTANGWLTGAHALTIASAAASLIFMFMVGRHQKSALLMVLFTGWVASPFVALMYGHLVARNWVERRRKMLSILGVVLSVASVAVYADVALGPARAKPASFFLVVPAASWAVIAIAMAIARLTGSGHD
jgi:hypothetical protein